MASRTRDRSSNRPGLRDRNSRVDAAYALGYRRGMDGGATDQDQAALEILEGFDEDLGPSYKSGLRDGKADRARHHSRGSKGGRTAGAKSGRKASGRGRRGRRRAPRSVRKAARQLTGPAEQQLVSGLRTIGLMFLVIALYLVLDNAGKFSGVIGGVNRGLQWLISPRRSIAYAPGFES